MLYLYRRPIKLVFGLLLLAGLVYGGLKGWMYYNVTRAMDELSLAAMGRADIAYGDIDTELTGVVRVHDLKLLPTGADQPLRIAQARVSGPGLKFFLLGKQGEEPPPRMRLDLEGIRIDLDPALLEALEADVNLAGAAKTDSCGPNQGPDPALLRELGVEALRMDAVMSYDYDPTARDLAAGFELDVHGIERVQADLRLGDVAPDAFGNGGGLSTMPTLAGLTVDLRVEPEFGGRYLAACAERRGQDVDTFRKALVADTLANLSRAGLQLGAGLTWAVETFHEQWGDLRITAEPPAPVNLMALLFASPDNWQRQLGVHVAVNRVEVQDLSFTLRPPNADELAVLLGEEPPPKPREPEDRYRYVYRDVPVRTLVQHLGAEVRVHLRDDQPMREGVLVAVSGNEARVEHRLLGGKMTAHVPLEDIVRLEVRQVEKIPAK